MIIKLLECLFYFLTCIFFVLIMMALTGCTPPIVGDFCDKYNPVFNYDLPSVPEDLKVQIDDNNLAYEVTCD